MFLWSGGPGKDIVKVLDFGLAKRLDAAHALAVTGPQDSIGSPCYMSPEQIVTPQLVDSRTDIWSLGVVLYRLLTDSLPFDGSNVTEVFSHVLHASPKPLLEVLPSAGIELDAIVNRCLEKTPDKRYSTMSELAEVLSAHLVGRRAGLALAPPSAPPPPIVVDDRKIRIPGVHARWPGVLVTLLVLAAAAAYQADRTGRIRIRDFTDGRITPAPLSMDTPPATRPRHYEPPLDVALGVCAVDPAIEANGALNVLAEPEPELDPDIPGGDVAVPAMSETERSLRQRAYRAYLTSQGLVPLRDVLKEGNPAIETP